MKFRYSLQPGNELSGESSWKVLPANNTRLTVVDWVRGDEDLGDVGMVGWVH